MSNCAGYREVQERLHQHRDQEQPLGSARVSVLPGEQLLDLPDEGRARGHAQSTPLP